MAGKSASNEGRELLKFGSMLTALITALKDTMAGKFDQLEDILTRPDIWAQDTEERDDVSVDDADNDNTEEPPSKKSKLTSSVEVANKQTVLNSIAEKMQMQEKKEKPDEEKLKEKLSHIIRPANCDSLVTTKVDELIWQRLTPQTRSFDSTVGLKLLRLALSSQSQFYQKC